MMGLPPCKRRDVTAFDMLLNCTCPFLWISLLLSTMSGERTDGFHVENQPISPPPPKRWQRTDPKVRYQAEKQAVKLIFQLDDSSPKSFCGSQQKAVQEDSNFSETRPSSPSFGIFELLPRIHDCRTDNEISPEPVKKRRSRCRPRLLL